VRPKWGIYRSLNSKEYLRDEQVRRLDAAVEGFQGRQVLFGDAMFMHIAVHADQFPVARAGIGA